MEVNTWPQLIRRRHAIESIGVGRRKWKNLYRWFPTEQSRLYSHMDVIYKEVRQKYGEEMFKEFVQQKHLNRRIYKPEKVAYLVDLSYLENIKEIKTTYEIYGRLPPIKYEACRKRGRFERF